MFLRLKQAKRDLCAAASRQTTVSKNRRKENSILRLIKKPHFWLAVLLTLAIVVGVDVLRKPSDQVTAKSYVGMVRLYQNATRPHIAKFVQCRYTPSCSEYSIEAVQKHGSARGIFMTAQRLFRCRKTVALGTNDPVN